MSYEQGSADATPIWLKCAPELLNRKVKLDDKSHSLADLWRRSLQMSFLAMGARISISGAEVHCHRSEQYPKRHSMHFSCFAPRRQLEFSNSILVLFFRAH
jgi:hypothetical protein